jgi:hypothetical protein
VIAKISIILSGANAPVYEYLQFKLEQEKELATNHIDRSGLPTSGLLSLSEQIRAMTGCG